MYKLEKEYSFRIVSNTDSMELSEDKDKVGIEFLSGDLHSSLMGIGIALAPFSRICLSSFHHLLFHNQGHIPKILGLSFIAFFSNVYQL